MTGRTGGVTGAALAREEAVKPMLDDGFCRLAIFGVTLIELSKAVGQALGNWRTGWWSSLSSAYIVNAMPSCRRLFTQAMRRPDSLALLKAGKSMPSRMAIMAMTTRSSIKVKPRRGAAPIETTVVVFILVFFCSIIFL